MTSDLNKAREALTDAQIDAIYARVVPAGTQAYKAREFARAVLAAADAALAQPAKPVPFRGPCTIKARGGRCMCEVEGLGPECVHRDPLIDGYPLTAGLPPPAAPQPAQREETGWLVEMRFGDGLLWWSGEFDSPNDYRDSRLIARMVNDASQAVRFARREDAQKALEGMLAARPSPLLRNAAELYSAQEHMWPAPAAAPQLAPQPAKPVAREALRTLLDLWHGGHLQVRPEAAGAWDAAVADGEAVIAAQEQVMPVARPTDGPQGETMADGKCPSAQATSVAFQYRREQVAKQMAGVYTAFGTDGSQPAQEQVMPVARDGWRLVPADPTTEMLKAAEREWLKYGKDAAVYPLAQNFDRGLPRCWQLELSRATHVYRAMLYAAPPAPAAQETEALARVRKALTDRGFRDTNDTAELLKTAANVVAEDGTIIEHRRAKCAAPQPAQEPVAQRESARFSGQLFLRAQGHPRVLEIMADCADCIETENDAQSEGTYDGSAWRKLAAELRAKAAEIRADDPELWVEPKAQDAAPNQAATDVLAERRRQVEVEGWTPEHDDQHDGGEMSAAGSAYALAAADLLHPLSQGDGHYEDEPPVAWPWDRTWWKHGDPRRMLVKAAALLLAEIERLDRATERANGIGAQGGEHD